jgi:hypothetical protein
MSTTSDWKIHRREERCSRCERPFAEGEVVYSLLALDTAGLRREDRCPTCFQGPEQAAAPGPADAAASRPAGELLFWRTRHAHDRRARFAVDFESIEELFLALEGRREERLLELRYLLALLLLRKKRLKLVGVRRHAGAGAGGETLCVRRPRRVEEYEVPVFELDTERALALKADLARVFEGADVETLAHASAPASGPDAGPVGGIGVGEADPAAPSAPA